MICTSTRPRPPERLLGSAADRLAALRALGWPDDALVIAINILLLERGDERILVDAGLRTPVLGQALAALAINLNSIERVIITHGHPDHVEGLLTADGALLLPNARYTWVRREHSYWIHAAENDTTADQRAALLATAERVDVVDHEADILPGIRAVPAIGHTPGHTALLIESHGERLLHLADAVHHPIQVSYPEWPMVFDMDAELAIQSRQHLLAWAARERLLISAYHFPHPGVGHVREQQGLPVWRPL